MTPGRLGLSLALAAVCLLLVGLLVRLQGPVAEAAVRPAVGSPARLPADPAAVDPPAPADRSDYAVIVERPLYQPDRRPYAPPVAAALPIPAPQAPPPPAIRGYVVVGIMVSGERRLAWVKAPAASSPAKIAEGDVVQGWRVKQIAADRVTFEAGTAEHVLEMKRRNAPPAGAR